MPKNIKINNSVLHQALEVLRARTGSANVIDDSIKHIGYLLDEKITLQVVQDRTVDFFGADKFQVEALPLPFLGAIETGNSDFMEKYLKEYAKHLSRTEYNKIMAKAGKAQALNKWVNHPEVFAPLDDRYNLLFLAVEHKQADAVKLLLKNNTLVLIPEQKDNLFKMLDENHKNDKKILGVLKEHGITETLSLGVTAVTFGGGNKKDGGISRQPPTLSREVRGPDSQARTKKGS